MVAEPRHAPAISLLQYSAVKGAPRAAAATLAEGAACRLGASSVMRQYLVCSRQSANFVQTDPFELPPDHPPPSPF